jgi:phosphoserine aminotransferase
LEVDINHRLLFLLRLMQTFDAGLRVSLYNAITEEETNTLIAYIKEFIGQANQ